MSELEPPLLMKVLGNYLTFPGKIIEVIWIFRTQDIGRTLNNIWGCRTDSDFSVVAIIWT